MKKTKMYAKKSLSLLLAVLMLMSAWVFVPGEHHIHADAEGITIDLSGLAAITGDDYSRADSSKIVICSDGGAGNTSVGNAKFDISKIEGNIEKAYFYINTGNHGEQLANSTVKVFLIDPAKNKATSIGHNVQEVSSIYGNGNFNNTQGVANAYSHYGVSEGDALVTISQGDKGQHKVDITEAVKTAKSKNWTELCFAFIMPQSYADNSDSSWSDLHINVDGTFLLLSYDDNEGAVVNSKADMVKNINQLAYNGISVGTTEVVAEAIGEWPYPYSGSGDWNKYTAEQHKTVYNNVIYSKSFGVATGKTSESININYNTGKSDRLRLYYNKHLWTDENGATLYVYNAETTLVYEGPSGPIPSTAVMFMGDGDKLNGTAGDDVSYQTCYITNANGLELNTPWKGSDGSPNFDYVWFSGKDSVDYTSNHSNSSYQISKTNNQTFYANVIKYTGSMNDSTYYIKCTPTFNAWMGNNNYDNLRKDFQATTTNPIYVINIVPWNTAIAEALKIYEEIGKYPAKYTPASVAKYCELATNLFKANANNYITASSNNVTGWASAAKTAVDNWNTWHTNDTTGGLELQQYSLIFERANGTSDVIRKNYGDATTVIADEASKIPNSAKMLNSEAHQMYKWNIPEEYISGYYTFTDDYTIYETPVEGTEGQKPHTNEYTNIKDGVQGSDDETGSHTVKCSACEYEATMPHEKLNNDTPIDTIKVANCGVDGIGKYDCIHCDGTFIAPIKASGAHPADKIKREAGEYIAPTCTSSGAQGYVYRCTECGQLTGKVDSDPIPALGHNYKATVTDPTCTEQGYTTYVCQTCGDTYIADYVNSNGHTEGAEVKEKVLGENGEYLNDKANCLEDGVYELVRYCSVCEAEGKKVEIAGSRRRVTEKALGHFEVIDPAKAPTCTESGLTAGKHCSRCNTVLVKQELVEATGHKEGTPVIENEVIANCKSDGSYDTVVYCTVCKVQISRVTTTIPSTGANGHGYEYTSTGDGKHVGRCTGCNKVDENNTTCSGGVATCVEKAECKDCKTAYGDYSTTNHTTVVTIPRKDSTCQVVGYEEYRRCEACVKDGVYAVVGEYKEIPLKNHKYGNWVSDGNDKSHTRKCTTCVDDPAAGLTVAAETADCSGGTATCTAKAVCAECGGSYGSLEAHVYDKNVVHSRYLATEATCTAKAVYYVSCYCGESSEGKGEFEKTFEYGEILPHTFDVAKADPRYLASAATCTSVARYYYSCACDSYDDPDYRSQLRTTFRYGELAAHSYTATVQKEIYAKTPATCADGGKYYYSCAACGNSCKDDAAVSDENKTFPGSTLTHIYSVSREVTKHATCNTPGEYYDKKVCIRCQATNDSEIVYKEIPATGNHKFPESWTTVSAATCGREGTEEKLCITCSETGEVARITRAIPATGEHRFATENDGWEITDPAECNKWGTAEKKCLNENCGYSETQRLAALGHKWTAHHDGDKLKTPATCQSPAVYYNHCSVCGMSMGGEAATHTYGEIDAVNGHDFSGEIRTNDDGTYEYKCVVEGCDEYGNMASCQFDKIVENVPSTCTNLGYVKYACTVCPTEHYKTETATALDPANHTGEATVRVGGFDALCDTPGQTGNLYYSCCYDYSEGADNTKALAEASKEIITDYAISHNPKKIITVAEQAPTCTADGWYAYEICSYCKENNSEKGYIITEMITRPKTGHSFGAWTQTNETDAEGKVVAYKHTRVCENNCGAIETAECSGGTATCAKQAVCKACNQPYGEKNAENHTAKKIMPEAEPTCQTEGLTAYAYCEGCGFTDIKNAQPIAKLEHVYPATWTQTVTEVDGVKKYEHTKTCLTCADGTKKATLTENCTGGLANCKEKAVCSTCKNEYGTTDPAVHKLQTVHYENILEATCTATGYSGDKCYDCCNAVKQYGQVTEMKAHEHSKETGRTPATCLEEGSVTYECENCDDEITETLPVDPTNHASDTSVTVGRTPATCTTAGYTGDIYHDCCYRESNTPEQNKYALVSRGKVIPSDGTHVYSAPKPEYMIAGYDIETDAEGNEISRTIIFRDTEPTYAEKVAARRDGKWYHVQQCEACGDILTKACAAYNHGYNCVDTDICDVCKGLCSLTDEKIHKGNLITVPGESATCMKDGRKTYYKCSYCDRTYLDKAGQKKFDYDTQYDLIKIDKATARHRLGAAPVENVPGSCGQSGYLVYECTVTDCGYRETRYTGIVSSNHTWEKDNDGNFIYRVIQEPTCGKTGYKAVFCGVCDAQKKNSSVTIPATGNHTYGAGVDVPGETCQNPGRTEYTCIECKYVFKEENPALTPAHVWSEDGTDGWVLVGGNCLEGGLEYERKCTLCDATEEKTAPVGEHEFKDEHYRHEATPSEKGYVIYKCSKCGSLSEPVYFEYEEGEAPSPGHVHTYDYDKYVITEQATCKQAQEREYTCKTCGEKERFSYGGLADHKWIPQAAESATCTIDGHTAHYRCNICEKVEGKTVIPATGHYDNDGNGRCDGCNGVYYGDGYEVQDPCDCMCHSTGFTGFIYKIVRFFWKLFKTNPSCACGNVHY